MTALLLAVSMLTRVPVRVTNVDRRSAGRAMVLAPAVGAAIGAGAAAVDVAVRWCDRGATVLGAVLAVATLVVVSGALHLDGLADTADALGVRGDGVAAQSAASSPGVGAFAVVAVALSLLLDVAAIAAAGGRAVTALVVGAAAGRLTATLACVSTRAARPDGSGAWVAETVSRIGAATAALFVAALAIVVGGLDATPRWRASLLAVAATVVAVAVGAVVRRVGVRRFGGLTGDVLGATIVCASTAAYVVVALTPRLVSS